MNALTLHLDRAMLLLPWIKVTQLQGNSVTLTSQLRPLNPSAAHRHHHSLNMPLSAAHLYAIKMPSGFKPLTKINLLHHCNSIWACPGTRKVTGHAFRICGMTKLLLAGIPPDIVKTMSCWSSDSFRVYWRSLNSLAHVHVADLPAHQ